QALEMGVTFYKYHEFLGKWIERYTSVAVTGSHGKTSTTGLLAHVLLENDPISYLIGDGTGKGNVDSQYFAFEACEYKRHYLDYFKNIDEVDHAFQRMPKQLNRGIMACGEDEHLQHWRTKVPIIYYGFAEGNDFQAVNIQEADDGTTFDVHVRNTYFDTFTIPLFGNHQILNALAVIAFCHYEGMESKGMKALSTFGGVKR